MMAHLFCAGTGEGRWANPEEAPIQYELFNRDITIKADSSEEIVEYRVKILNETGRENFGIFRTFFNQNIQKIEILEAKSIHDGLETKVPSKNIEIKPVVSEPNGFDQMMQASVTYPNVSVGSTIYLKFKLTIFKQPFPNYYSRSFYLGQEGVWTHCNVNITSHLPLHIMLNDPRQKFVMTEKKEGEKQLISLHLKEGEKFYEELVNEPHNSFLSDDHATRFAVSTFNSFDDFAKASALGFQTVIDEPLPPLLQEIKQEAVKGATLSDQINIVTSKLAEKIRYLSDRTTIEGRFSPRSLKVTVTSATGDCKDFSAATVAILKALGHNAHVALVIRGAGYLAPQKLLPSVEGVNHAIVKVTDKDGKIFWVDPTNVMSIAGKIFPDIANRPAVVLDLEHPSYDVISDVDPESAKTIVESEIELNGDLQNVKGKVILTGEDTLAIAGATLFDSEQAVQEKVIKMISGEATPLNKIVNLPDLRARIVPESLRVEFSFSQKNNLLRTNLGHGVSIDSTWGGVYTQTVDGQEGTMYVGTPSTLKRKKIIKDINGKDLSKLDFSLVTPWLKVIRKCDLQEGNTVIAEDVVILKSFISAAEINSAEFKKLKESIKEYCQNVAVIFP
ncbi:DUF3857 domain-containing protein [Candidatus Paracaedibacter symbiosus]|uniref:DUF3857 domain-containing protein n=1 Tax=Candidatus Paracaedibacter symbiosus TaxID=244582 RepID=UPI0018DC21DE|nr:DUF3857 domain-containing transglutaminase family protein [Candidatus Paracaedibacter symbiosus]